uniref:Uncharacterized protein n=1 Tax=Brassica oleracea var. oleracea TaxID=109376 RepID=A0A0D3AC51_BRAOL
MLHTHLFSQFRYLLKGIAIGLSFIQFWSLDHTLNTLNTVSTEIAQRVIRDHIHQFYVAWKGPRWLRETINSKAGVLFFFQKLVFNKKTIVKSIQ